MRLTKHSIFASLANFLVVCAFSENAYSEANSWSGLSVAKGNERGYVETPMGLVHYQRRGEGAPLLLLHQTPWFSIQYAPALPILAELGIEAIAPDRPGYGFSDGPDKQPSIDDYADNLSHVIQALGYDRVSVLGHHTGASVAAALAHRYPELVERLILNGVPFYNEEERKQRLARTHWTRWLEADGAHLAARFSARAKSVPAGEVIDGVQWSTLSFFLAGDKEWFGHTAAFSYDMLPAIREIKADTLILVNRNDSLFEQSRRAHELRRDFQFIELEGGYSHVMYDYPRPWAIPIAQFILNKK